MRALLIALCVSACTVNVAGDDQADMQPGPTDESGGGLPTPGCGAGFCSSCVGCSVRDGLCFGLDWRFDLGVGQCVARTDGTLSFALAGVTFTASGVAAVSDDSEVQVSGVSVLGALTFRVPAELGTHDCSDGSFGLFAYFDANGDGYWNRPTSPRPACTVTLTAIGAVGERIEGSFAISLSGQIALEVTAGTFSVDRSRYP